MTKIGRVLSAYLIATLVVLIATAVGYFLAVYGLEWELNFWIILALAWLVVVGIPTIVASIKYLLRQLGVSVNPTAWLSSSDTRVVPVGSFNHNVPTISAIDGGIDRDSFSSVELTQLQIRTEDYIIGHEMIMDFLRNAWNRQRSGKPGLSRRWWTEYKGLERGEYEALLQVFTRYGLVHGRRGRRSGKIPYPPVVAWQILEDNLH